ncbi:MAG: zinc finger Ran-binding domain-containing protein [Bacteroidota bacterium]
MMDKAISSLPNKRTIVPALKSLQWECGHCGHGNWKEATSCKKCAASKPVVLFFSANTTQITLGEPIRLSWDVDDAVKVQVIPDEEIATPSGEMDVYPTETTTYRLIAENKTGRIEKTLTLTLDAPKINDFAATENVIQVDYPCIFHWEVENGAELTIDRGVGNVSGRSFAEILLEEPGVYTLTAKNASGQDQAQIELSLPVPEIGVFYAGSEVIRLGQASWLHWEVNNATEISLSPDIGNVTGQTKLELYPDRTTEYTLRASNYSGVVEAKVQLTLPPPVIREFAASSPISTEGEPVTISWNVENAYRIEIIPDVGEIEPEGSCKIKPYKAYTDLRLRAYGHSGVSEREIMITLFPLPLEEAMVSGPTDTFIHMEKQDEQIEHVNPEAAIRSLEKNLTLENDFLVEELEIQRAMEMDLTDEMLAMQRPSIRRELKAFLKKVKDKLNKR